MVVGDLGVVHIAAAERLLTGSRGEVLLVGLADGVDDPRQGLRHVLRKVPAVGPGIADQLALLVELLGHAQGLAGTEAVEPVGVALQLGEVVEQGWRELAVFRPHRLDGGLANERPLANRLGQLAIGRQPASLGGGLLALEPGTFVGRSFALGAGLAAIAGWPESGDHLQVVFRHEGADLELSLDHHRQGGGLHPADRESLVVPAPEGQGAGAGEVHAHQPVGAAATPGGVGQAVVVVAVAQPIESALDGVRRQGRDPQAADRFLAAGGLVDVAEDQLALAPGVRGAHHLDDLLGGQNPTHQVELLTGGIGHHQRPFPGQHRQMVTPPGSPRRVDLVGLGEGHQVADRPGDGVAVAVEIAVTALAGTEDARDVAGDGRLFGDHGDSHRIR